ncbi:hypothetical protein [Streptomyces sp. NPDC088915]|uniref:hypothetical protein n=1 Tax=Streptomyces sp. NPDC088915 TaxID=3365912 RepID=UPI0037FB7343
MTSAPGLDGHRPAGRNGRGRRRRPVETVLMDHDVRGKGPPRASAQGSVPALGRGLLAAGGTPARGHLGAVVAFGAYTAARGAAVRRRGVEAPDRHDPWDVPLTAAAVFRLSRLLAK